MSYRNLLGKEKGTLATPDVVVLRSQRALENMVAGIERMGKSTTTRLYLLLPILLYTVDRQAFLRTSIPTFPDVIFLETLNPASTSLHIPAWSGKRFTASPIYYPFRSLILTSAF